MVRLQRRFGVSVGKIAHANVGPSFMYLALKNVALQCTPKPKLVVVLYYQAALHPRHRELPFASFV